MNATLNLTVLLRNVQGGAIIKTILPEGELDVFNIRGQGLYAWVTESQYMLMVQTGKRYKIKFGQYGTYAVGGSTPQDTINSYSWVNEPIVILWAYRFLETEIERDECGEYIKSAYIAEGIINKNIGSKVIEGKGTETFMTTLDIIKSVFSQTMFHNNALKSFTPRIPQQEFIDKYIAHRKNGGREFLLAAIMRYGKNFSWLCGVRELISYNGNLLVLTSKPGVFDTLKKDIMEHVYFADWEYVDLREVKIKDDFELDTTRISIVVVSTQLSYNKVSGKSTQKFLARNNFDDTFLDECHAGTDTEKFINFLASINSNHYTFGSGTPYKTIVSRGFTQENTYFYGYVEQQHQKWTDIKNDTPNSSVTIDCIIPSIADDYRNNVNYSDDEQFRMSKLLSVNDTGEFNFGGDVRNFLLDVLGKSNNKHRYSPYRITSGKLDHTIWLLPNSTNVVKSVGRLLNDIAPEYKVIVATGNETTDITDVHGAIGEFDKTITLTIGRFVEGTTVEQWTGALVFSETESIEKYFQFIFRIASPYIGKDKGYVFDFSTERTFQMMFEMANTQATNTNRNDSQNVIKEWLDCYNVYHMDGGVSPKRVEVGDILEKIKHGDYRSAALTKTYKNWFNTDNLDKVVNVFSNTDTAKNINISTKFISNEMKGGKTAKHIRTGNSDKDDKIVGDLTKTMKNIVGIISTFPLYSTLFEDEMNERTLEEILRVASDDEIRSYCKVGKSEIQLLIDYNIIDTRQVNYYL